MSHHYRFYREHKYLSFEITELERFIAKANFPSQLDQVRQRFDALVQLMQGHAHYEDTAIHPLLRGKSDQLLARVEADHVKLDVALKDLDLRLAKLERDKDTTLGDSNDDSVSSVSHQFYLAYRRFVALNLLHLDQEESLIMPELNKHYTDSQLQEAVEFKTYNVMTVEQMIHMVQILFPHMNICDKLHFLKDLQEAKPSKFEQVWVQRDTFLDGEEKEMLKMCHSALGQGLTL